MAKLTVNHGAGVPVDVPTPTQEIIRAANKTGSTKDVRGRVIKFRRMMPSLRQRLRTMAGPELSQNMSWFSEAVFAYSVTEVDGEPVFANTIRELEILMDLLDDDGLNAVFKSYLETFGMIGGGTVEEVKN